MPRTHAPPSIPRRTAQQSRTRAHQAPSESPTPSSNATELDDDGENGSYTDDVDGELLDGEEEGLEEEEGELEDEEEHTGSVMDGVDAPGDASSVGLDDLKEIGGLASWTVSTAKPGCGVEQLREDDTNLYWQSDGPQPHTISIHFAKRVFVSRMRLYLDHDLDESYTPTKIGISSGTGYHDLQEVTILNLEHPKGWIYVDLDGVGPGNLLKTYLIEVKIHANHQNGKDTHVRGLQIFSNIAPPAIEPHHALLEETVEERREPQVDDLAFKTSSLLAELEIR